MVTNTLYDFNQLPILQEIQRSNATANTFYSIYKTKNMWGQPQIQGPRKALWPEVIDQGRHPLEGRNSRLRGCPRLAVRVAEDCM